MTQEFSFKNILKMAKLADSVYDNSPLKAHITEYDIDVIYLEENKQQIIAIEGTSSINHILSDMNIFKSKDKRLNIKLHSGFAKIARKIYSSLFHIIKTRKPIVITGHSMGGAVALILGMYLQESCYEIKNIITFGQPKVTDREGAEKYKSLNLIRVVHDEDIVPSLPPITVSTLFNPYIHFGDELIIDSAKEDWWIMSCGIKQVSFWKRLKNLFNIKSKELINDHKIDEYITALEQIYSRI